MAQLNPPFLPAAEWRARLHKAIPGGAPLTRVAYQFPQNALLSRGASAMSGMQTDVATWTGMALRAVTLGYGDQRVNAAAATMNDGVNLRATCTELQARKR